MYRLILLTFALLAAALVAVLGGGTGPVPTAGAAPSGPEVVLDELLPAAPGTTGIACHASYRPGTAGVATETVQVPAGLGHLEAELGGAAGDWDIAVFDTAGNLLAASAELDAMELATGWTPTGGALRVQACRRSGDAGFVPVTLSHESVTGDADALRADPPQLVGVSTPTRASKERLQALGLDMTEHGGTDSLGVVLHGVRDRLTLERAGFDYEVLVPDLIAQSFRQRRAEDRALQSRVAGAKLPSGRTGTYRRLVDYETEMKQLAKDNPGLVRTFVMPNKTWLGREVMGIEITENVNRRDGKPAFFNMGVHHAREWPAGEMPMEWAHELVTSYKAGDARAKAVVEKSRNIIVPIVNPDGFNASREAGQLSPTNMGMGQPEDVPDTAYLVAGATTGGEYRRKNCRLPDDSDGGNCSTSLGLAESGVDPNRNYGALWGGPGADTNPATQTYRGKAPFSEPETRNVQSVVSTNHVMSLITNHTTAALVLRAPGLASLGDPVDEDKGYKALGDAMAKENGYFSQKSFELYDTTGTTEDWSYNATGGFGFTFEIYCGAPNYETGDCDDPAFHPTYATGVEKEWDGTNPTADHTDDPGPDKGYDGKGNREAYYIAAESAMNEQRHSVIEGSAPAGATLRLTKQFKTATFPQENGEPILFDDKLETVYDVRDNGRFEWHINPSTRPIVAKASGREPEGPPSAPVPVSGAAGPDPRPCPDYFSQDPENVPDNNMDPTCFNDHPFTFQVGGGTDNETAEVAIEFAPTDDWDLEIYEDVNGDGLSQVGVDKLMATSGNGATNANLGFESATLPRPAATTKYVARVINFAALTSYDGAVTFTGPPPRTEAKTERWTLTCEVGGKVLQTTQVEIERGERKTPDLAACVSKAPDGGGNGGGGGGGGGNGGGNGGGGNASCLPKAGFRTVGVKPGPRGRARLAFRPAAAANGAVDVKVYRQTQGRRITKTKVFARFDNLTKPMTWNGRSTRGKKGKAPRGFYFVRYRVPTGDGADVRRVPLRRTASGFKRMKPFYRRSTCGKLRQFKLGRPVFGGAGNERLKISFLLGSKADVRVVVRRGKQVVRRFTRPNAAGGTFHRLALPATGRRGTYRVTLTAGKVRATLFARRI